MAERTQEEGLALLISMNAKANAGKFSSKLSFGQRCEILALHRTGCTRELLAKLYNVDRRTVTHIYNDRSTHYRDVREEEKRIGRDNFIRQYVTPNVQNTVLQAINSKENAPANNRHADGKQGVHMLKNDMCDYEHRVVIGWLSKSEEHEAGWYYKDLDSEWPNDWFHGEPETMRTSQAAYAHAQKDISDKLS